MNMNKKAGNARRKLLAYSGFFHRQERQNGEVDLSNFLKNKKAYGEYVKARMPKSPLLKDCAFAFLIGGLICSLAETLLHLYLYWKIPEETAKTLVPVTLVFVSALLTGLGVFDDIAKFAGAGTLVPITGFANSVAAPAIENKSEGLIMGVGAKMFTIAGPVIVYGTLTSVLYGVIYWIVGLFG